MYSTLCWCRRRDSVSVLPRRNLFFVAAATLICLVLPRRNLVFIAAANRYSNSLPVACFSRSPLYWQAG
jgi:hypothetical protein